VRSYTVEPGKSLTGSWNVTGGTYSLSVHGPNGFLRQFQGSVAVGSAVLSINAIYGKIGLGSLSLGIVSTSGGKASVNVLDAYTGSVTPAFFYGPGPNPFGAGGSGSGAGPFGPGQAFASDWSLTRFHGWYDLVVTVAEDPAFRYRLAGHVETGLDSWSDPAMGGLVQLKA
jgi:phospholipase C